MFELLEKVGGIAEGLATSLTFWLSVVLTYFIWCLYDEKRERNQEVAQLQEVITTLTTKLNRLSDEERRLLLEVVNKYHDGYANIKDILTEIKTVLETISSKGV
jgi:predicted PurR-regulated permease PerM